MVIRVETGDCTEPTLSASSASSSSIGSSDYDLEGGYSSQEDNGTHIVSKVIPTQAGKMARRRSQCEQLSFRQRSVPSIDEPQPAAFRRWSTITTSNRLDLPKNIQFSSSATEDKSPHSRIYYLLALLLVTVISAFIYLQHAEISSLRQELQITKQHREYMEREKKNILVQVQAREQSLDQMRHTHEKMTKVNQNMSKSMAKLRLDYIANSKELERLRPVERRLIWSESRWEKYAVAEGVEVE